jgi:hypothetical protein
VEVDDEDYDGYEDESMSVRFAAIELFLSLRQRCGRPVTVVNPREEYFQAAFGDRNGAGS